MRVELAGAMRERGAVVARIEASRSAEQELYEYLRTPGRTAAEMSHVARYGSLHRQKIFDQTVQLRQYDKGIELIRTRLVDARAKREALDRMYEKARAEHRAEQLAEEQRELDEVATMRHVRRLQQEGAAA